MKETCLDGEVHVPRGVDNVDLLILPAAISCSALNGDALLALKLHMVHLGAHAIAALDLQRNSTTDTDGYAVPCSEAPIQCCTKDHGIAAPICDR